MSEPMRRTEPGVFSAFERMVALRYVRARRQGRSLSFAAMVSLIGIGVGVGALIIVMSVMNGMRHQVLSHILGVDPHVRVERVDAALTDYESLAQRLRTVAGVRHVMPVVDADVMVIAGGRSLGGTVHGVDMADLLRSTAVGQAIIAGDPGAAADVDEAGILIGSRMAYSLGVAVGDELTLVTPDPEGAGSGTVPKSQAFRIAALFGVDNEKYDTGIVFMPIAAAQRYYDMPGAVSSLDIAVDDPEDVATTKAAILAAIPDGYQVRDWRDLNAAFVSALKVEGIVTFILLALIVLVAAFNIVSGQVMLVKDKGREIAILRTMGATRPSILRIFFLSGAGTGVFGTLLGVAVGLAVSGSIESIGGWLSRAASRLPFPALFDFLSRLPAIVDYGDVAIVVAIALALSFAATFYPAWRAARLDPVEALRYE
jgi:lipoprotein-releasing system permease protein